MSDAPDHYGTGPDPRERRYRRVRRARLALDTAIFLAGVDLSLWLLGQSSLAKVGIWLAVFLAVIAFAIFQRETHS